MSVLEEYRKETPFFARDNMLDIWKNCTELSFRGFGIKKRKSPKTPKNFDTWSKESQEKWKQTMQLKLEQQERWDLMFIHNETHVVDGLCRKIVYLIDRANTLNPQYLFECDDQRLKQDEAIGYCNNLRRELNHIADTIPCNKNFVALLTEKIDKELDALRGWRKSCNSKRKDVIAKEIKQRKSVAEKIGFITKNEDLTNHLEEISNS